MASGKSSPYQAYSQAVLTVPKTRQIVMLYDGAIRFVKQAQQAIEEKRIEDRYNLLLKASKVMTGLQNSLDFEKGGDVATTLHQFYLNMSVRILSVNFKRHEGKELCDGIIGELKQMRDVWNNIDLTLHTDTPVTKTQAGAASKPAAGEADSTTTFSA